MTREIKFGLLLVLGLTSVFGFMVYKRMHQPMGLAAGIEAEAADSNSTASDPFAEPTQPAVVTAEAVAEPAAEPVEVLRVGDSQPAAKPARTVIEDDPFSDSPKPVLQATESKPKAPELKAREVSPLDASDPFTAQPVITRSPPITKPPAAELKPVPSAASIRPSKNAEPDDPFTTPALTIPAKSEASAVSTTVIERPVEKFAPKLEAPALRSEPDPLTGSRSSTLDMTPPGEKYVVQPSDNYWTISKKVYGTGRYFQALQKHNEAAIPDPQRMKPGTEIATPAVDALEARYADLIPDLAVTAKSALPAALGSADTYVTAAGDNFWSISKKVYGSGRFFQALAEYNRGTIPDPLKLRAGTAVQTPPAEVLQAKYSTLLDGSATANPRDLSVTAMAHGDIAGVRLAREPASDAEPSGFFVDASDQPCYRVGPEDTLTGIARSHLGRSSRWVQILEMNRSVLKDGNTLNVGTVLRLPPDASQVQAAGLERR